MNIENKVLSLELCKKLIENKVPSLELCKKLFELGITKHNTEWSWTQDRLTRQPELYRNRDGYELYPAPDLYELIELLDISYGIIKWKEEYYCHKSDPMFLFEDGEKDKTAPNAIAKMLIRLKEDE